MAHALERGGWLGKAALVAMGLITLGLVAWQGKAGVRTIVRQVAEQAAVQRYAALRLQAFGRTEAQAVAAATRGAPVSERAFLDCKDCPLMVAVPAGGFSMGTTLYNDEQPPRAVTISRAFAVGVYTVTFAEWNACVTDGYCSRADDWGWGQGTRPVINVSWNDVTGGDNPDRGFLAWLNKKTGGGYRLPSEAEWEYAARAGSTGRYAWGDQDARCSPVAPNGANFFNCLGRTEPVGTYAKAVNAFGLYDVQGNVWEWVEDCYRDSYVGAPADGSSVETDRGGATCSSRVLRGGNWNKYQRFLRSAQRDIGPPTNLDRGLGFRVAKTVAGP
jgi:formylglycine-generating enzyme required for sulfatase activity